MDRQIESLWTNALKIMEGAALDEYRAALIELFGCNIPIQLILNLKLIFEACVAESIQTKNFDAEFIIKIFVPLKAFVQ